MLDALRDGRIGFDHARLIADQADSPNRDNLLEDIDLVLGWAVSRSADDFRDALAGWARDLDERREVGMTDHERQLRHRKVRRTRTKDGLRRTILDFDDETDAVVYGAVRDIVADMLRAENKAKKDAGDKPDLWPENRRATPQIWADAFAELARRSRAADVITKHRARPTILAMTEMSVLWDQLQGQRVLRARRRHQAHLPPDSAAWPARPTSSPWSSTPTASAWTWATPFRLATYKQRLALRAMHATCAVEGCDMDFDWCEIHHLHPWEHGGLTDLDNLVPLCSYHHHLHPRLRHPNPRSNPTGPSASHRCRSPPPPNAAAPATSRWEPHRLTLWRPAADAGPGQPDGTPPPSPTTPATVLGRGRRRVICPGVASPGATKDAP